MKILHLSTFDSAGGAARGAYRIHQSLKEIGVNSQMLVRGKTSSDPKVLTAPGVLRKLTNRVRADLNRLPLKLYPKTSPSSFSVQWFPDGVASQVERLNPELIHLHWLNGGHLQLDTIARLQQPLVWTLHDMWPFTGGCHYSAGCDRYTKTCGNCPVLESDQTNDLSHWLWQRKVKLWQNLNLTLVASSSWMAKCASASSLFGDKRIEVIPLGLDLTVYKPLEQQVAREAFNLPKDKKLILFGAIDATKDRRKGFHLLQPALQKLSLSLDRNSVELVVFGSSQPEKPLDLGFKTHYLGRLSDDPTLALAYSAADVMVVPSTEEAFGQTASEALACGTPVVGFADTGVMDIVDRQENGYLAQPYEVDDLAYGISWVLDRAPNLRVDARNKAVARFSLQQQAASYQSLYQSLIDEQPVKVSSSLIGVNS